MKNLNRRDLGIALTAIAALGGLSADAQAPNAASSDPPLSHSAIFPFEQLTAKPGPNGMLTRAILRGTLATGEYVEVHETTLQPGQMPHPPHRHTHSEFLLIREGKLEVDSDGQTGLVGPGGVVFTASRVLHSLKNVGTLPANYFVVAVGLQQAIP